MEKYEASRTILCDCDGVILDWERSFHHWMVARGYDKQQYGVYQMHDVYNIPFAESMKMILEFNNSSWIGKLRSHRDSRTGIATLVDAGYRFVCITSLSLDQHSIDARVDNLNNIYGVDVFLDVISLDTGSSKEAILKEFAYDNFWWIEDLGKNAAAGADVGLRAILLNHKYNVEFDDTRIKRVDNWKEITDIILK